MTLSLDQQLDCLVLGSRKQLLESQLRSRSAHNEEYLASVLKRCHDSLCDGAVPARGFGNEDELERQSRRQAAEPKTLQTILE